jgi:hypothetical protein
MNVSELSVYVKFVFFMKDKEDTFSTSDIEALKDFVNSSTFKIGDIIEAGETKVKILDIQIKQVDTVVRSNKTGFSMDESSMTGKLKDSLLTIHITVEQLLL